MPMQPDTPARILAGEVLTSPGPRKQPRENNRHHSPELAEDSGGVLMLGGKLAWMWVADGASDMHAVSGFSSRLLAQDLGRLFTTSILENPVHQIESSARLAERLNRIVEGVAEAWNRHLDANKETAVHLARELEFLGQTPGIETGTPVFFEFASNFSTVCLDLEGRLAGASMGDSYLLCNPNGLLQFFALKKNTITLRLKMEEDAPVFTLSRPQPELFENEAVDLAALATDGCRDSFHNLHRVLPGNFQATPENLALFRRALGTEKPKTEDDKTLAWLGRIHAG